MGHRKTKGARAVRALLAPFAVALFICALAPPALAAGPTHAREAALDVTGLNHACGAAVDSEGDLYALSAGTSEVKVYDPEHNELTSIADSNQPCGLAVTTTGALYVSEQATGEVVRFKPNEYPLSATPSYGARETIDASGVAKGIAVDPYDNRLYVAEGSRITTYNSAGNLGENELQRVFLFETTGGTFKLKFGGEETAAIPYNATAEEVEAALEALAAIGAGNVGVASPKEKEFLVTFSGALGHSDVEALEGDASGLSGGANKAVLVSEKTKGFGGQIGEGTLTEATGVAAYTYGSTQFDIGRYLWVADAAGVGADRLDLLAGTDYKTLKLRRELTGASTPDGSFGFGSAGAYLAADPGNREAAGNKCVQIAEQACTSGHLFLYDSAHAALDEFDASGEYLDQTTNAGFADAGPSAVAIDRSGGANDGTLYVTAGAGAGARALAFDPLKAPSRAVLGEPISKVQQAVTDVATDSHGNVYVLAGAKIRVYAPDGTQIYHVEGTKKLAMLEDKHDPYELALDSTGRVYVRDGNAGFPEEFEVTYYTPSEYPPTSTTTYTRQEPAPVTAVGDFGGGGLNTIAVNPGPGPGKDHLFVGTGSSIHEYDSAANGSTLLNGEFAKGILNTSNLASLAVDGRSGNLYMANSGLPFKVFNAAGTEVLARINESGGPAGPGAANPHLAVDSSNGHVLEYDNISTTAREYDASGAFVAEFGSFTDHLNRFDYGIAFDSACATHEPPLDETTTPTCAEYDPANSTLYVAVDDSNPEHPPYDVTAFGPLSYPQAGEAPAAVTGIPDGFAPGAATLHGTVDPKESPLEECSFQYLTESEYQENTEAHPGDEEAAFEGAASKACAESPGEIGEGNKAVPVHADIEGLAEAPYRFRLFARNAGGTGAGKAVLFGAPQIEALSPLPILYTEATLRAKVNPTGLASEYRFEYLDAEAFEAQGGFEGPATHRTAWAELAAGEAPVTVSAALVGLGEGTEYRYRALAKNDAAAVTEPTQSFSTQARRGAESCPNGAYRFGLSANLPDCRAYELVTPAQTDGLRPFAPGDGHSVGNNRGFSNWLTPQRGAAAGGRLSYFTEGTLPGFEGNGVDDGYRGERGAGEHPSGGWQSALFTPGYAESAPHVGTFRFPYGLAPDQLYSAWENKPGPEAFPETLPLGLYLTIPGGIEAFGQGSLGTDLKAKSQYVSAGGAHVIFTSAKQLEPTAPESGTAIYDRTAGQSSAEVVSVAPDGTAFATATYLGATEDGVAVAFSAAGALYLHRGGKTTEIATGPATFAGISADGARVFYAAGADGKSAAPLYVCDAAAGPCAGEGAHAADEIAAAGIFALVSPDGSHAFFSSTEALSGGEENDNGEAAEAGERNLYAWDGGATRFVGVLSATDFGSKGFAEIFGMNLAAWTRAIGRGETSGRPYAPTRSSATGGAFAFQSHARLTAYDNEGVGEIYRYEPAAAAGRRLLCVSCDPSGAPPSADALLEDIGAAGHTTPLGNTTMIASLTDNGQGVFFQSFDRLLPEDANDAEDVYEWKAKGAGGCTRPGGCLALISSGQGEVDSYLYAMSADGHDVFFATKEKLVGMDQPGSPSLYDARVGGGIPEPSEAAPCQGDACQGSPSEAPAIAGPATIGAGGGNEPPPAPKRCAKGKRRVKGRCVKRRACARHRHRVKGRCVKRHANKHHRKHRAKHNRRSHR